ncbi:MAG: protein-L-isoaspartate(D-aspartate) O-methyltransferase [Spirochaetes bacterium]|nr:protein-L-isoaspartate(D-aspartate) O-methyltransferase [Spirochaetota bacterium]
MKRSKKFIFPLSLLLICFSSLCGINREKDLESLREKMIRGQIESRGVRNSRVINAIRKVERHKFVPKQYLDEAYEDHPLPIGHDQTISQPYIVALMTELCELNGTERVLEIGTGSGYQAAVLSLLSKEVFTIEIIQALGKSAAEKLKELGYNNVTVKIGDGYKGWADKAPFDVIILTASPPEIPDALLAQLGEGGIIVAPVGDYNQELIKIERVNGNFTKETVTYVRFVPMIHGKD